MSIDFQCKSFGKWILAGEHAVLRGVPALVFPIQSRCLELSYSRGPQSLDLQLVGDHGKELQDLVWSVLDRACLLKGITRAQLTGSLLLRSSLPVGAGMGASAALCVALTRWLGFLNYLSENEYYDFARNLENLFHGESSGVDIAVALSGEGLRFVRDGGSEAVKLHWQPLWYISYSGKRGVTLDAVTKVKEFIAKNPEEGLQIDKKMAHAVSLAEQALQSSPDAGFEILKKSILIAGECFDSWNLNEGAPTQHMEWLREQGAVAVKPTGSGGGGYVLSLWKQRPSTEVRAQLIEC